MNTIKELIIELILTAVIIILSINEFFKINKEVFKNNKIAYGTILFLIFLTIIMI